MPPQLCSQANVPLPGIEPNASKDDGILINLPFKRLFTTCWALMSCVNGRKKRATDDVKEKGHDQTTSQPWRCDSSQIEKDRGDHFMHHYSSEDRVEKCTPSLWFKNPRKQAIDALLRTDAEAEGAMAQPPPEPYAGSQLRA
ncbi:hypothetical protein EJ05DRAFT_490713 [Pseudovirgaria hyperparasitica]|uniref:Uncharacterized protein n=1 Tax=Pseudovirgaria hyperparasitica TaxID=470096 RepID=A0A6A6VS02_9PEZI|nr:uncharacterized protein EJ05DRAFT_490713 [Pseudovirgaria hyperparasitica]KAF2752689.1 hypothetical protein EJ05DRAFT_490713 [Pseudovirgaria hyperparasitica]